MPRYAILDENGEVDNVTEAPRNLARKFDHWVECDETVGRGDKRQNGAFVKAVRDAQFLHKQNRQLVNHLLQQSEWTQSRDSGLTNAQEAEWKQWRQSLRTALQVSQPNPEAFVVPEAPGDSAERV